MPAITSTDAPVVLRLSGIGKRFGDLAANADIELDLRQGEVVALLGENGAGKTTLMSILFGHYVADSGTIEAFGQPLPPGRPKAAIAAGIAMVHQHFTLAGNLTVLDNVILGTESLWRFWSNRRQARKRLVALSTEFGLDVDPDAPVGTLSVGEKQRVEILKALYRNARILILDEPTAVLTPQESDALFATLRQLVKDGLSILFISHKLSEVLAVSDRVVVLRGGRKVADLATATTDKATLAERMVGRALPTITREQTAPGEMVLQLTEVTVAGQQGRPLLDRASLTVHRHEILGIAGVSGNGQTALADLVAGMRVPSAGQFHVVGKEVTIAKPADMVRNGIGRIPEDRHATGLIPDMTVVENLIAERFREQPFSRHGFLQPRAAERYAREIIADFDVRCSSMRTAARLLSGGNMQKLILGRVLSGKPHLILANQPTRGLDIGAVAYVQERLLAAKSAGAGILLISDDLEEILSIADRIVVIHRGGLSRPLRRGEATIRDIGLMMAGQLPENCDHAA